MLEGGADWRLRKRAQVREAVKSSRVALWATTLGITVDVAVATWKLYHQQKTHLRGPKR